MGIEAIMALVGAVVPPAFDFVKKKWLKPEADTIAATITSLATTKPDVIPDVIRATSDKVNSDIKFFNRDVVGTVSQWVVDLRAAIRPIAVVLSLCALIADHVWQLNLDPGTRGNLAFIAGNWVGSRISQG